MGKSVLAGALITLISVAAASCGTQNADNSSTSTQSVTSVGSGSGSDVLPAGTTTGSGPGSPPDVTSAPQQSMPLTPEQMALIAAANALYHARNPTAQSPTDRGFPGQASATGSGGATP